MKTKHAYHLHNGLADKKLLLVGGDPRQVMVKKIQRAFNLQHVFWLATRENNTRIDVFLSPILNGQYDLVIALCGLMRHQHLAYVRRLTKLAGVPLIVLTRSPSVERIAYEFEKIFPTGKCQ
ncbi:MAG: hypothetical protein SFY92_09285 [Verrucomicrobiae bacterium]|nr:hypothetical protein [Verrucomicrobiae bacterium]